MCKCQKRTNWWTGSKNGIKDFTSRVRGGDSAFLDRHVIPQYCAPKPHVSGSQDIGNGATGITYTVGTAAAGVQDITLAATAGTGIIRASALYRKGSDVLVAKNESIATANVIPDVAEAIASGEDFYLVVVLDEGANRPLTSIGVAPVDGTQLLQDCECESELECTAADEGDITLAVTLDTTDVDYIDVTAGGDIASVDEYPNARLTLNDGAASTVMKWDSANSRYEPIDTVAWNTTNTFFVKLPVTLTDGTQCTVTVEKTVPAP